MSKNAKEWLHLLLASIRSTFNKFFPILQKESQFDLCSIQGVVRRKKRQKLGTFR